MMYLDLVNMVIAESAAEQNQLTGTTWDSPEAGRRLYPRIKNYVSQAWEEIQMSRDQWEFMSAQANVVINPRFKFENGSSAATPVAGDTFTGQDGGFSFVMTSINIESGDFTTDDAAGWIEFANPVQSGTVAFDEEFDSDAVDVATFNFKGPSTYNLQDMVDNYGQAQWETFRVVDPQLSPSPLVFIPWNPWLYDNPRYFYEGADAPVSMAQDPFGNLAFYPVPYRQFVISFVYTRSPQILEEAEDVPLIQDQYHKWIAWEALLKLALYDKNQQLVAYANKHASFYRRRAEANLMPLLSWRLSPFDEYDV